MTSLSFSRLQAMVARCQVGLYLGLALFSGALLPIQAGLNAQLARSLDSVPLASATSYLVGAVVLITVLLLGPGQRPTWSALAQAPRWSLFAGVLGSWYIVSSTYFTGVLGASLTLGFAVGGQAIAGLITDHFGWLGVPRQRLSPRRQMAAGLLVVALVFLMQPR